MLHVCTHFLWSWNLHHHRMQQDGHVYTFPSHLQWRFSLPFLLTLPYSSWYTYMTILTHRPVSPLLLSKQFYATLLSISQSPFFFDCSILAVFAQLISAFYVSICLSASKTVVSNFFVKLATDSVMLAGGIPSCNKLVVSKSISHARGTKLHTEHYSLQQSAPPPVSYSAPYSCTLPDCVPAV